MKLSLEKKVLVEYVTKQLNTFFPDSNLVNGAEIERTIDLTLDRINYCFKHVKHNRYFNENVTLFNHLYSDHYLMFLWFLSNTSFRENQDPNLSNKLYYLNKCLHGFDCMYDTKLPDIFLVFHGVGTMLGKAMYDDFFVVLQGCTVGSQKGHYPKFGKGVSLVANSSVIGDCTIDNRSTISTRTTIFKKNIEKDKTVFMNYETGKLEIKNTTECYAQQFFNVDLNTI